MRLEPGEKKLRRVQLDKNLDGRTTRKFRVDETDDQQGHKK